MRHLFIILFLVGCGDEFISSTQTEDDLPFKQSKKDVSMYEELALKEDDVEVQKLLGKKYYNGKDVNVDYAQAFYWYEKAALNGDKEAQFNVAQMHSVGLGVEKQDLEQAFFWYEKAASNGDVPSQYHLAQMYELGHGVTADEKKAFFWYEKAASNGDKSSQYTVAFMYYRGQGVKKNYHYAYSWFERAANNGHILSAYFLGVMNEKGEGVDVDYRKAYVWYSVAGEKGVNKAKGFRDNMAEKLPPNELFKANKEYAGKLTSIEFK